MKKARVFIVDDFAPMRDSLRKLLALEPDLEVCGEASNVTAAYEGIQLSHPDVAIVDLVLGPETGIELLRRLNHHVQTLPVLILSMLPERLNASTVLDHGARGYIMKSESPDHILDALRRVLHGEIYLSPEMSQKIRPRLQHE